MTSGRQEFELLRSVEDYLPDGASQGGRQQPAGDNTMVTREELRTALRRVYAALGVSVLVCVAAAATAVVFQQSASGSGTTTTDGLALAGPPNVAELPSHVAQAWEQFRAERVANLTNAESLWTGEDAVIVPYGFKDCDSAAMPPQIAPARRAGNFLFLSGILGYDKPCVSAVPDHKKQIEAAFQWTKYTLDAAKASWKDVMMVTSYHVNYKEHLDTFTKMREKYLPEGPYPGWTMVQVGGLYYENQVMELAMIARLPPCNGLEGCATQ